MQEDFLGLMRQLGPDLAAEMARRALVLERIAALSPVGRHDADPQGGEHIAQRPGV